MNERQTKKKGLVSGEKKFKKMVSDSNGQL